MIHVVLARPGSLDLAVSRRRSRPCPLGHHPSHLRFHEGVNLAGKVVQVALGRFERFVHLLETCKELLVDLLLFGDEDGV